MIKAEGIHKTFEDFTALDNITCNISDGCIYGMVGSNGAGKSTFLRTLNRMNDLIEGVKINGQILIDGKDIYKDYDVKVVL